MGLKKKNLSGKIGYMGGGVMYSKAPTSKSFRKGGTTKFDGGGFSELQPYEGGSAPQVASNRGRSSTPAPAPSRRGGGRGGRAPNRRGMRPAIPMAMAPANLPPLGIKSGGATEVGKQAQSYKEYVKKAFGGGKT